MACRRMTQGCVPWPLAGSASDLARPPPTGISRKPHAATYADMLSVRTVAVALSTFVEKTSTSLAASDMKSSTA